MACAVHGPDRLIPGAAFPARGFIALVLIDPRLVDVTFGLDNGTNYTRSAGFYLWCDWRIMCENWCKNLHDTASERNLVVQIARILRPATVSSALITALLPVVVIKDRHHQLVACLAS